MIRNSRINVIVVFSGSLGVLLGFLLARSNGAFQDTANVILAAFFGTVCFGVAFLCVGEFLQTHPTTLTAGSRFICYMLSAFVLFGACWLFSAMGSAGGSPGDEDVFGNVVVDYIPGKPCEEEKRIYVNLFLILFSPTMLGVRLALGDPVKNNK